ncbi:MAG: hypothetical protein ACOX61_03160 [Brooklawnia sp.]
MVGEILKTRLDRGLFVAVSVLSVITLATGALAVHAQETERAERLDTLVVQVAPAVAEADGE